MERRSSHQRPCFHGRGDSQLYLLSYLYRRGRERQSVGVRHRENAGPHGSNPSQSEFGGQRQRVDSELVSHQCHLLHRIGRVVGTKAVDGISIDRRTLDQCQLRIDMHWQWRHCLSGHYRHCQHQTCRGHQPDRLTQHGEQRRYLNADLGSHQCNGLHGLRRLVRDDATDRLSVNRSFEGQIDLRVDLYRFWCKRNPVRDGFGQRSHAHGQHFGGP